MATRVVVTGLGIISPIGIGVAEFWKAALEGRSGISAITSFGDFPMETYRSRVAGQIHHFNPTQFLDATRAERVDRYAQFALVAAKEAVTDAGLRMDQEKPHRVGVIVGAGMGGMVMGEREITQLYKAGDHTGFTRLYSDYHPEFSLGHRRDGSRRKGPNLTISTACSSSAHALGQGLQCIRNGQADVVIVVGADASITPLVFAGFCSLRALSTTFNDTPERASRPFDRSRDGFVMGEGAGALILESLAHAKKRKARIYAEVAGYAATSEAYHMVIPKEDGLEVANTMRLAMENAGISPSQVDYINAHATSTPIGDAVEAKAIRHVFKSRADRIAINATKSMVGHTLGAAGAIAGTVCALSIQTGQLHPTINYDDPDPACALNGISSHGQRRTVKVALLNAFGFGSNNAAVVFTRFG